MVSPDGLDASDTRLIEAAARRAAARFPWYRDRLGMTDGKDNGNGPLAPILREADLATTYYATGGPAGRLGKTYTTSGTSAGVPKRVWWPAEDHARYVEHRAQVIERFSGPSCKTACADLGTGHAADSALEIFSRAGLRGSQIDVTLPVERHVELLRRQRPDLLFTMPMILERVVAAGGPGYVPRRIVVVGDLAPHEWRRAMADRIGLDPRHILDVFGSIEVGAIAHSDTLVGAYLFHAHIIPEVIRPNAGADDRGLLVLTSLERDGFPVVRYVSGDLVAELRRFDLPDGPRWGYTRHLGREGSELKHGEMLSLHSVALAMAQAAPGVAWEMRRAGLGVVIDIDRRSYTPTIADDVRTAIRGAHPSVDQMIRSGLVGDIAVQPASFAADAQKHRVTGR